MSDPDPRRALEQYRRHAAGYDASARRTMGLRRRAIDWLELAPGARVVAAGVKYPPAWLFPLRLLRRWNARPYLTTLRGLDRPWGPLEAYVEGMEVQPVLLGTNYIARGRVSATIAS